MVTLYLTVAFIVKWDIIPFYGIPNNASSDIGDMSV